MKVTTRIATARDGSLVTSRICVDCEDVLGIDTYVFPLDAAKNLRDALIATIGQAERLREMDRQLQEKVKAQDRATLRAQIKVLTDRLAKLEG